MAQYDGAIRINTKIDSKEASSQLMTLENRIVKTADKIASLRSKMDSLKDAKIPTEEYKEISVQIEKATQKIDELRARQEKILETGGKESSSAYKRIQYDIDELSNSLPYLEGELQDLVDTGKAFALGSDTEEFSKLGQQLQYAENDLDALNQRHNELLSKQDRASKGYKRLGESAKKSFDKINKSTKKTNGFLGTMATRFKGLLLSLLIFNQISKAFNALVSGVKEGMKNLAQYSNETNQALSLLMSRSTYLKNALATAFSPIVEIVTPILVQFIELLGEAATKISELFSALMGKDTFTKAIKVQQDYAGSLKDTAKNTKKASKETEKALAPFDDLRQIIFQKDEKSSEESETGELSPDKMFKTDKVSDNMKNLADTFRNMIDSMKEKAKELKDIFTAGFWNGLGNYKPILSQLKSDFASIGTYLKEIFTDANVMDAAKRFVNSFVFAVGSFFGMIASLGLTIAANIVGGIEAYLAENVERIKGWLIRMFDIGTDINYIFSNFFAAFANVFSVFASQTAQDITASVIQIFSDIFGGILEITGKFVRDTLDIMLAPFTENQEKIKKAISETLEPVKTVVKSIADTIRKLVDGLVQLYDEHIHPLFVSLKEGLSEIYGNLLDGYNQYIVPVLNKLAEKFKEVMEGPVGDAINSAIEFLGKLFDAVRKLWEEVLQPFVAWIADNIMPVIAPVVEAIGMATLDMFAGIAEVVSSVLEILGGLIDFVVGVFTGNWQMAWQSVARVFQSVWNAMVSIVKTVAKVISDLINGIIKGVQKAIEAINKLLGKQKDAGKNSQNSGGRSGEGYYGSSYSGRSRSYLPPVFESLPYNPPALATGTVVPPNREFLATLGDNKREVEVVSPLSTMKQAFMEALQESGALGGGQSGGPVYLQLDGKTLARLMNPYMEAEKTRVGVRMVTGNV